ncbi:DUF6883 domain-containing protein [Mycolicibacterium confluentis]|uniref:Uncharacterized protein n=1 Tax=Mycolicibacterium confluentis TaxID=28047 RepID=A0A7I7Y1Z3_9MYCO|nr:DUF6883 domain-containing protein [Mycolicibacterium confluentis]MCV7320578.1 hypothetical protein [Mycolicibacterium confluentis]ORV30231.1 hypothetical protein AWB99_14095 [Mycolicibacterium confluentis]BBZ35617.1 hypothetical protein MCNF_42220 [Mycolicibacterium confluentis]
MTLTVAEIERWSAGDVREVFHAATSRAQAAQDAADGIATLPALTTWGGEAAATAKEALTRTRLDLATHSEAALAVAAAARRAADNIGKLQAELRQLEIDADDVGLQINGQTNRVERKPGATHGFRWQQQNIPPLQERLDRVVALANLVDEQLANAISMADGTALVPAGPAPPTSPSPDLAALQHANDEAMVKAAQRVEEAREALAEAMSTMYVHGPGTPEFDAASAQIPVLKSELAQALAEAGSIPDFSGADPTSVGFGRNGVNFTYKLPDGRTATVTSTKLKDGTVELWDNGASAVYRYKDGQFVGTRFLDHGRAEATAEPLFSAVTTPFGLGPAVKGGQAAYHGLRSLFARESAEALVESSTDDVLARGSEIVASRGESAADNLAAGLVDDIAAPAIDFTTDPIVDPRKFSEYALSPEASKGKSAIFDSFGYRNVPESASKLVSEYTQQAGEKILARDFTVKSTDQYGTRIAVDISLPGVGDRSGETAEIVTGWIIRPDGTVSLTTPFSGFTP